jgi:hypothetical protein
MGRGRPQDDGRSVGFYQNGTVTLPSNMNERNIETPSSSPSSSMYARPIRMIKMAGGMLLKGKGVSNNKTLRSRIAIPIATKNASV